MTRETWGVDGEFILADGHLCTHCEEYQHGECRTCSAQAVAAERERIRAAVEGLPDASFGFYGEKYVPGHISRAAVLAAIEKRREETDADD